MGRSAAAVARGLRKVPDWAAYIAILTGVMALCIGLDETADAPAAARDQGFAAQWGPMTSFDPETIVEAPARAFRARSGTAFSIDRQGRWITARHVVEGCRRPAVLVGGGRAVAAAYRLASHDDLALLITDGGPAGLPMATEAPTAGELAFHPGYPQGRAGEVASRFLGRDVIRSPGRRRTSQPVLAWAGVGRTEGLDGALSGLSGAPALDRMGRVVAVTIAEAPRRGRLYTTTPAALAQLVRRQVQPRRAKAGPAVADRPITVTTYGQASNDLRRDLRVAQVLCLS